ncbi:MAG: hypothetical protein LC640_10925 [Frankia sp.]|nr:hypothetical protein [Frankia sp.]
MTPHRVTAPAAPDNPYAVALDDLERSAHVAPEDIVEITADSRNADVIAEERALRERMLRFAGG